MRGVGGTGLLDVPGVELRGTDHASTLRARTTTRIVACRAATVGDLGPGAACRAVPGWAVPGRVVRGRAGNSFAPIPEVAKL